MPAEFFCLLKCLKDKIFLSPIYRPKIHHQIRISLVTPVDFDTTLSIIKVLDACKLSLRNPADSRERRGATTEAYEQYAAGRSDRRQRRR